MIGQTISHYKITEKLGEGGMGVVYKAEDTKLERPVALKFLRSDALEDDERKARFLREARAVASLNHPNICVIHEIDEIEGESFIAMELVEGESVKQKIKARPLKLDEAVDIAVQTAQGLQAAHEKGIVHRDIKSSNLIVTPQGRVKVMDFGLARLADRSQLTKTATILGTPAYMSPEQARKSATDRRTDIWSLGVVIYEMVTGALPFERERLEAVLYAIGNEEPEPITALRAGLPMELEWIVGKALAKDADERYQHVEEMVVDLRGLDKKWRSGTSVIPRGGDAISQTKPVDSPSSKTDPQRTIRRQRVAMIGLAAALTIAAVGLLVPSLSDEPSRTPPVRRYAFAPAELRTTNQGAPVVVSPNGRYVAYVARAEQGEFVLRVRDLSKDTVREIAPVMDWVKPFWSPDSRFLAFSNGHDLKKVSVEGGPPTTVWRQDAVREGAWSPDGASMVVTAGLNGAKLYELPAVGGDPRQLAEKEGLFFHSHFLPAPRNRYLLYVAGLSLSDNRIILRNLDNNEETDLGAGVAPVYSSSGHILSQRSPIDSTIWALPFSLEDLEVQGEPFPVAEGAQNASVASDGTLVYFERARTGLQRLVWRDRWGAKVGEIGQTQEEIIVPSLSPDGRYVGVEGLEEGAGRDVWLHDVERPIKIRLTFDPVWDSRSIWSPDSKEVAFASARNGSWDLFIKPIDGSAEATAVLATPSRLEFPDAWSSDGRHLLFHGDANLHSVERRTDGTWTEPVAYTDGSFAKIAAQFSPDGSFVAYCSNESGRHEVYVGPFPKGPGKRQVSLDGETQPRWSRDGNELFYVKKDTLYTVAVSTRPTFTMGETTELFTSRDLDWVWQHPIYDVSLDGRRFVTVETIGQAPPGRIRIVHNWYEEFRDRERD